MKCPVCDNDTLNNKDFEYDICEECFWEYDPLQVEEPDYAGGANVHCLNDYKKIYKKLKKENSKFSCRNEEDRELIIKIDHNEIEFDYND